MIRAILFDKDGTLIDFHGTWMPAYRAVTAWLAATAGQPDLAGDLLLAGGYDPETGRAPGDSVLAAGSTRALTDLWRRFPAVAAVPDMAARVESRLLVHVTANPAPTADLPALFDRLCADGLALGIATMDSTDSACRTAARLGIADRLAFVTGYDGGHGEKPGPGMVHGFCAAVGVPAAAVLVIGDTLHDLAMARAAGAGLAVGVLTGAGTADRLDAAADHVVDSIAALPDLLAGLPDH